MIQPGKWATSLFSKLLLIILLAGFIINLLVVGFFIHVLHKMGREPYRNNIINYMNYLIRDMGTPPDFSEAQRISRDTLLQISYEGPEESWSTSGTPVEYPHFRWRTVYESDEFRIRTYRGRNMVIVYRDGGKFTFMLDRNFRAAVTDNTKVAVLIVLLTVLLGTAYFAIRWVLKPVRWLQEGVNQVGRGNLAHRVPSKRSDELGNLAQGFNDMTGRIRNILEDRDQLLLDVSHELRTPLTRMKVALEFLEEGRAAGNIREDVVEMETMITAILEEARLRHAAGKIDCRESDLVTILASVIKEYQKRKPRLDEDVRLTEALVWVEPELIKIVFRNIINNAIKYSDPEGPNIQVALYQEEASTIVAVSDRGSGIPAEDLSHVFEPFYRVDKSRSRRTGGYGIGLSLCKTIMDGHSGGIDVESIPGRGTTVKISFPSVSKI